MTDAAEWKAVAARLFAGECPHPEHGKMWLRGELCVAWCYKCDVGWQDWINLPGDMNAIRVLAYVPCPHNCVHLFPSIFAYRELMQTPPTEALEAAAVHARERATAAVAKCSGPTTESS